MGIIDLFSKRQKRLRGEMPDVYQYDEISQPLRVQIVHIIRDAIGISNPQYDAYGSLLFNNSDNPIQRIYKNIHDVLCREYGQFKLTETNERYEDSVLNFLIQEKSIDKVLDVIELCFQIIPVLRYEEYTIRRINSDNAISELNARLKEHGVGYQFESHEIIRVDSEFLHTEAVKPALLLLRGDDYKGANDEFLSAHEYYRHGKYKECLVDLNKAFESTMKTICKKRGWEKDIKNGTTGDLIRVCFENNLLPSYLDNEITSLRKLLESGIAPIRNKNAAHGQGDVVVSVPAYIARYALNLTASTLLFLIEAEMSK
jgi:hypothetical protein